MNCDTCKHFVIPDQALLGFGNCRPDRAPWHWLSPLNRHCVFNPPRWEAKP